MEIWEQIKLGKLKNWKMDKLENWGKNETWKREKMEQWKTIWYHVDQIKFFTTTQATG